VEAHTRCGRVVRAPLASLEFESQIATVQSTISQTDGIHLHYGVTAGGVPSEHEICSDFGFVAIGRAQHRLGRYRMGTGRATVLPMRRGPIGSRSPRAVGQPGNAIDRGPGRRPLVLCIEEDQDVQRAVAVALERGGFHVIRARSLEDALGEGWRDEPDLILIGLVMPDDASVYDLARLQRRYGPIPIVVLSTRPTATGPLDGVCEAVVVSLQKPLDVAALVEEAHSALGRTPF